MRNLLLTILIFAPWHSDAAENPWYTQGKFKPVQRLEFTLTNTLDFDRENVPVTIKREGFPIPDKPGVRMGAGFRKKPEENQFVQEDGIIISSGPEAIKDPENIDDRKEHKVKFIGTALIVKKLYKPEYQYVSNHKGNHTFKIGTAKDNTFEFMVSSAWSEGAVYNNMKDFTDYIRKTSMEYNSPVQSNFIQFQKKE